MGTKSRHLGVLVLLGFVLGLTVEGTSQTHRDPSHSADELFSDYYNWRLRTNPEYGTRYGIHTYDENITELTEEAFDSQKLYAEGLITRAHAIPDNELDKLQKINLRVLLRTLQSFVDGYAYRKYSTYNNWSPLSPPTASWKSMFDRMKYETMFDYEKAFSRMRALRDYVDQRIVLMTETIALNLTVHEAALTGAVEKIDAEIVSDPKESTYYKILFSRTRPNAITTAQWSQLKVEGENITTTVVIPAWRDFRNFINDVYSLRTRPEPGAGSLEGGLDYYKETLKWYLTVDMTPDQVHELGLQEVDRITKLMENEMKKDGNFMGTLQEYIAHLKSLPSNFYNTEDELIDHYTNVIATMHDKMTTLLVNVPQVMKTPNAQSAIGSYSIPSDARPYGIFWANVFDPDKKPKSDMAALTLHEAEPGHHTMFAYAYERLGHLPVFRRQSYSLGHSSVPFNWLGFTSLVEGWALYAEALGEEIGAYDEPPHSLFGRYASEIFRAVRLVVDTGIHAKGWTKDRAMAYIANYTTFTNSTIENEVNRYISIPGQACSYKIGQLKISELRETAAAALGNLFDLREFNEEVLKYGIVPLSVLEEIINEWIMEKKLMQNPPQYVNKLFDEYISWRMKINPEYGARFGNLNRQDQITQLTEESFIKQKNEAEELLDRVKAVSFEGLPKPEKISYKILRASLQSFVDGFPCRKLSAYNGLSPLESPTRYWTGVISAISYKTEADYEDGFARLNLLQSYVDQRITLMNEAIRLNLTAHSTSLTGILEKIDEEIVQSPQNSSYYKILFDEKPDNISSGDWSVLQTRGADIIQNNVVPAWQQFRTYLANVYMPNTRIGEGLVHLKDGLECYQSALKWHLTIDMTADEIHQKGLDEVTRISTLMNAEKDKDGFTGTLQEYIAHLRSLPYNFYQTEDEMLDGYREIIADVHSQMPMFFNNLPEAECRVQKDPNPQGVIGSYSGPTDSRSYGIFWANVFEPEKKPKSSMAALTLHEAEPGHHTHIAYIFEKLKNLPLFRKSMFVYAFSHGPFDWPTFTSSTEGWALYAESLGEEMGAYTSNHSLFGRYTSEIFRAVRLVVDSGIHAKGWTKQEAMDYIAQYSTSTHSTIENEVNRYISWPGQACAYKIGQLKILELRNKASALLGNDFDLKEFHDQYLQLARIPLEVMEEFMDDWIQEKLKMRDNKKRADALFEDFFQWRLMDNPEYGTKIGVHTHDSSTLQWTEETFIARLEHAMQFLEKIKRFDREGLDEQYLLNLDVFEKHLETFIGGFRYRKFSTFNAIAPLETPTDAWYDSMARLKYDTIEDYNTAFTRLGQLGVFVDQRIALLNASIENKLTLHNASLYMVADKMGDEVVANVQDSSYFVMLFNRTIPAGISESIWEGLKQDASQIIMNIVVPAWQKFKDFLEMEYQPRTRPWEGVWSLPGGLEYYQACLVYHTSSEMTPEEIHQIGLKEVERIDGKMKEIMSKEGFAGTLQEYMTHLRAQPENYYTTEDEMIQGFEEIVVETQKKVPSVFKNIPSTPVSVVKSTNPQSANFYSPPPLDGSRDGMFVANVFNPETKPKFTMVSLTLHETVPGHHLQVMYTLQFSVGKHLTVRGDASRLSYSIEANMPLYRRAPEFGYTGSVPFNFPYYNAYVEGWALYSETLGLEMDAFDESKWPHSIFGMYVSEMFRAVRLVVDTGIHAFGWSKERAMAYTANYSTYAPERIENEINRYISWPGQACGYKIGQLKIEELKQKAISELGVNFEIKEFHDEVLKVGGAPLGLLERQINNYIASKKAPPSTSSSSTSAVTPRPTASQPQPSPATTVRCVDKSLVLVLFFTLITSLSVKNV